MEKEVNNGELCQFTLECENMVQGKSEVRNKKDKKAEKDFEVLVCR